MVWESIQNSPNIVRSFIRQALTSSMRKLLTRRSSTKSERRFHELLKALHISFQTKVKIGNREIDFVIKKMYAVDIDGHKQDVKKNRMLMDKGYYPIHFHNNEIPNPKLIEWLTQI